jgi:uncharacterized membrane protein YccC
MRIGWTWPRGAALRYCVKVALASLLGYGAAIGGLQYALYGAFTAALVVGASRGEDVGSAWNRACGSIAGMAVGIAAARLAPHPGIAVAVGIALTAYLCMGCGWGQASARIGASLAAVTILAHSQDALEYSAMRVGNTLIGIAAGLAVSYFVLPVRGRDLLAANIDRALEAVAQLLSELTEADMPDVRKRYIAVFDGMVALEKTLHDARREIGGEAEALRERARHAALVCLGALNAGSARAELAGSRAHAEAFAALREQAAALARRAKASAGGARLAPGAAEPADMAAADQVAVHGFAHALRRIDRELQALGH